MPPILITNAWARRCNTKLDNLMRSSACAGLNTTELDSLMRRKAWARRANARLGNLMRTNVG